MASEGKGRGGGKNKPPKLTWEEVKGRRLHYDARDGHGGMYVATKVKQRYELIYMAEDGGVSICKGTLTQCQDKAEQDHAERYPSKAAKTPPSKSQQKKARKARPAKDEPPAEPVCEPAAVPPAEPATVGQQKEVSLTMLPVGAVFHCPPLIAEDSGVTVGELLDRNECASKVKYYKPGEGVIVAYWSNQTAVVPGGDRKLLDGRTGSTAQKSATAVPAMKPVAVKNTTKIPVGCTEGTKGGKRFTIFNLPATHILRWMGHKGWTMEQAQGAIAKLGLQIQNATFSAQLGSGKKGDSGHHGKIPKLDKNQEEALSGLLS